MSMGWLLIFHDDSNNPGLFGAFGVQSWQEGCRWDDIGGVRGSPRLSWLLASRMHVFNQLSKCVNVLIPNYNTQKIQSMIYRINFDTIGIPRTWRRYDGSLWWLFVAIREKSGGCPPLFMEVYRYSTENYVKTWGLSLIINQWISDYVWDKLSTPMFRQYDRCKNSSWPLGRKFRANLRGNPVATIRSWSEKDRCTLKRQSWNIEWSSKICRPM